MSGCIARKTTGVNGPLPAGSGAHSPSPTSASQLPNMKLPPGSPVHLPAIETAAANYSNPDSKITALFKQGLLFPENLATVASDDTVFVSTGDIHAEWLRDSSAEVRPYIYFAKVDATVSRFVCEFIARQAKSVQANPYANAFNQDYSVWEDKFELDSLAYIVTFAWSYWQYTGDTTIFTSDFAAAMDTVLTTLEKEQDHANRSSYYRSDENDTPVGNTGMVWTGFRPSDDPCQYHFLIPSEMMTVVALGDLAQIEGTVYHNATQSARAQKLRQDIHNGIQKYGIVNKPGVGMVYAYEVDGLGHANFMDDANIPSLLSAPYLGYGGINNPTYQATRQFVLSSGNPFYAQGSVASGVGSPHTPQGYVWPLAILMKGFTSTSRADQQNVIDTLVNSTTNGTLIESFDPNSPRNHTRDSFGWPNALFTEYMMTVFGNTQAQPFGNTQDLTFQ